MKFFTADWHLGGAGTLDFDKRPFKSVERMNEVLIANANRQAKSEDTIYMVGDFITYGDSAGYAGLKIKPTDYLKQISAKVILLEGNHDKNNRLQPDCSELTLNLGNYGCATVSHFPSTNKQCFLNLRRYNTKAPHIHICGHVHSSWPHMYDQQRNILNINVGVDVCKYNLIRFDKLIAYVDNIIKSFKPVK